MQRLQVRTCLHLGLAARGFVPFVVASAYLHLLLVPGPHQGELPERLSHVRNIPRGNPPLFFLPTLSQKERSRPGRGDHNRQWFPCFSFCISVSM